MIREQADQFDRAIGATRIAEAERRRRFSQWDAFMPFHSVRGVAAFASELAECLECLHALVDLNQEVRIEQRVLVHAVPRISAWIAYHPRSIQEIVEAVVGMSMYP